MNQSNINSNIPLSMQRQIPEWRIRKTLRDWGLKEPVIRRILDEHKAEDSERGKFAEDSSAMLGPIQQPYLSDVSRYMSHRTRRSS